MPQEIHVVQCFSCLMYQTDIVKKTNKWKCKLCGEKQTVRNIFGKGSGKECRLHVQQLNDMKRINDDNSYNMMQKENHERHQYGMLAAENFDEFLEFNEENLDSVGNDCRAANDHTSIRQNEGAECSYSYGNRESFIALMKESTCLVSMPIDEKPLSNVLSKYLDQLDGNASKKLKMEETNIGNVSSKWSHLLSNESGSEEDDQISYVHSHQENVPKYLGQLDGNASKQRNIEETNIGNVSSKWSHLLSNESGSEEDDQISYVHSHQENVPKYLGQLDGNASKQRNIEETNISNVSSKWSHLLSNESGSEEDDQISYVHSHQENIPSGAKRKNIFVDAGTDDF